MQSHSLVERVLMQNPRAQVPGLGVDAVSGSVDAVRPVEIPSSESIVRS
jgi:hypothetical protein